MNRLAIAALLATLAASGALADDTPPHTIAVAGEAELLLAPDYASIELGVVTQATLVGDALADNNARMTRVIAAMKALGIADRDIRTSTFLIEPKFEPQPQGVYGEDDFRTIVGYHISNKVTITLKDLAKVAQVIDASVKAGANASGTVTFGVNALTARFDDARRKAVETALHKAQVLTDAAHMHLGPAISITDNEANMTYNSRAGYGSTETVVVTGSRIPTPIEPGLVSIHSTVTVLYMVQ